MVRPILAWLCAAIVALAAQAAQAEFVQYNYSTGALTLNDAGSEYDPTLDNITVYMNSTSGVTLNGSGGNFVPSGTTWGGYIVTDYSLEWYYSSGAGTASELAPGTYTLATLPTNLGASAFGNSYYGSGNTMGAVLFGERSGSETNTTVTITPELPGTMLGLLLLGGAGMLVAIRRQGREGREQGAGSREHAELRLRARALY